MSEVASQGMSLSARSWQAPPRVAAPSGLFSINTARHTAPKEYEEIQNKDFEFSELGISSWEAQEWVRPIIPEESPDPLHFLVKETYIPSRIEKEMVLEVHPGDVLVPVVHPNNQVLGRIVYDRQEYAYLRQLGGKAEGYVPRTVIQAVHESAIRKPRPIAYRACLERNLEIPWDFTSFDSDCGGEQAENGGLSRPKTAA
eukprot:gnl/MRDRNA2_/MRDRNA2_107298_c0_seq1.p1 gnl/MRDRNA2_/MRDRNA2_107298_c0~~gnl/MRDRNA2_/MRDRNA2_107298_c0_seq1.p1  ORF type:complete len:219 (+),score=33.12 gnl/MRDRNA2_/MRDRNA2_107298_c0_seq1:59-658(+)